METIKELEILGKVAQGKIRKPKEPIAEVMGESLFPAPPASIIPLREDEEVIKNLDN